MIISLIHWLYGNVFGNIVANVLWIVPGYAYHNKHMKRLHARLDYQDQKLSKMHKHIRQING